MTQSTKDRLHFIFIAALLLVFSIVGVDFFVISNNPVWLIFSLITIPLQFQIFIFYVDILA